MWTAHAFTSVSILVCNTEIMRLRFNDTSEMVRVRTEMVRFVNKYHVAESEPVFSKWFPWKH